MKKKITKSLSFCLALVLMLSVFSMAAAAAGHIHNYVVTDVPPKYICLDDNQHQRIEKHKHLCSCGDTFYEMKYFEKGNHEAASGSEVNKGSYWVEGGICTVYQYTCKYCGYVYTRKEISITKPASTEQAE